MCIGSGLVPRDSSSMDIKMTYATVCSAGGGRSSTIAVMRIAYLVSQYPMVSHSFIRREILALEQQGFEVMRIALRAWDAELLDPEDNHERERTRYVLQAGVLALLSALTRMLLTHPVRFMQALMLAWRMSRRAERPLPVHFVYLAEACRIQPWLRAAGVRYLHAHFGSNPAEIAMLIHTLGGPPWSFTVHGPEEFDKAPILGLAEKVRRCSFVVAVSSFGRSQLYRLVGKSYWPKVHVVHCGLDRTFFDAPASPLPATRRLVCVGRLCEQKGQLLLVEAARLLAKDDTIFELVLAGDGEMRKEIELQLQAHGLAACVRITGWLSGAEVKKEILAARALVLPSFAEGLPVVLMEAMALRRPVISTYVGGIPELVRPGTHGWLVPAGDVDALGEAMRECLDSPVATLTEMGEAARERVLVRHDVDREAAKLAALICQTVGVERARAL
jgi:colanic acid/amylovoran biosynthesis glycosyltransferase